MKKLNLGCGNKIKKGWVNVDLQSREGINKSFNFEEDKYPFKKDTFDYVLIDNVLEHIVNTNHLLNELHRICKPGAIIEIIVPYYNSYAAYNDPSHVHYFNERCIHETIMNRSYEDRNLPEKFKIVELNSVPQRFIKFLPKKMINFLKRILGNIVVELRTKVRVLK